MWFGDDITWCIDGEKCGYADCFRNIMNRKSEERIFTCACLYGSVDCEKGAGRNEKSISDR